MDKPEKKEETVPVSNTSSSSKRKKEVQIDPRTPLKRQRIPTDHYQYPVAAETRTKPLKEEVTTLYKKGVILALRGDGSEFYLCRTAQFILNTSKSFKLEWLSETENPGIYFRDWKWQDRTEVECILTEVRCKKIGKDLYQLSEDEKQRVEEILKKALQVEKGILLSSDKDTDNPVDVQHSNRKNSKDAEKKNSEDPGRNNCEKPDEKNSENPDVKNSKDFKEKNSDEPDSKNRQDLDRKDRDPSDRKNGDEPERKNVNEPEIKNIDAQNRKNGEKPNQNGSEESCKPKGGEDQEVGPKVKPLEVPADVVQETRADQDPGNP